MKRKFPIFILFILLALILSSCGALGFIGGKAPKVTVHKVKPKNFSLQGFDLFITLKIENKTPGYITFKKAVFSISIEGKKFTDITNEKEIKIEARKSTYNVIKVPLKWREIARFVKNYYNREFLTIGIKGKATIYEKLNLYIGFSAKAKIPAIKIIPGFISFKVEKLNTNIASILRGSSPTAQCSLNFYVKTVSKTKIFFKNAKLVFKFAGATIGKATIKKPKKIIKNKSYYTMKLRFKPTRAIFNILMGRKLKAELKGTFDIHSSNPLFQIKGYKITISDFITIARR